MSVPPALIVRFGFEEAPDISIDARNDAELARLFDWIDAHPRFLRVIAQLFALADQERAT